MSKNVEFPGGARLVRGILLLTTVMFSAAFLVQTAAAQNCAGSCQDNYNTCLGQATTSCNQCYDNVSNSYNACVALAQQDQQTCLQDCTQHNYDMCAQGCDAQEEAQYNACMNAKNGADQGCEPACSAGQAATPTRRVAAGRCRL